MHIGIIFNFAYVLLYTFVSILDIFREVPFLFLEISINIVPLPYSKIKFRSWSVHYIPVTRKSVGAAVSVLQFFNIGIILNFAYVLTLHLRKHSRHFQIGTIRLFLEISDQYNVPLPYSKIKFSSWSVHYIPVTRKSEGAAVAE